MADTISPVLTALGERARRRGWRDVEAVCDALAGPTDGRVLIATAAGVDATAFEQWLQPLLSAGSTIERATLKALDESPVPALRAELVFVLFPAAVIPEGTDVDAAGHLPSRTLVLIADQPAVSADDLALARKIAWGVFVPEPKASWAGQSLAEHGIYLWCATDGAPDDRAALVALAGSPHRDPQSTLERAERAAGYALHLADGVVVQSSTAVGEANAAARDRLDDAGKRLATKARTLLDAFEAAIATSLRTARRELRDRLPSRLASSPMPSEPGAPRDQWLEGVVQSHVETFLEPWRVAAVGDLAVARKAWVEAVDWSLSMIEWTGLGDAAPVKKRLEDALPSDLTVPHAAIQAPDKPAKWSAPSPALPTVVGAAVGVAVGFALGGLVGGTVGGRVGAAVGAAGGYGAARVADRERITSAARSSALQTVERAVSEAERDSSVWVAAARGAVLDACRRELDALDAQLTAAERVVAAANAEHDEDTRALAEWHEALNQTR